MSCVTIAQFMQCVASWVGRISHPVLFMGQLVLMFVVSVALCFVLRCTQNIKQAFQTVSPSCAIMATCCVLTFTFHFRDGGGQIITSTTAKLVVSVFLTIIYLALGIRHLVHFFAVLRNDVFETLHWKKVSPPPPLS